MIMNIHHKEEVSKDKKVSNGNFICDHRPLKTKEWRVRLTVGGEKLSYDTDAGSSAVSLLETKLILNSKISDAVNGARFIFADLKDYFLEMFMANPECMKINYTYFPKDIRTKYYLYKTQCRWIYLY